MAGGADSSFISDMADGLTWDVIQYGLEHPQINAGGDAIESITIPSYTFITGKFTLDCEGMNQIMGEVSFIYCPTIVQNEYFIQKVKNPADGLMYPVNCLVYTIRRTTGTSRYVIVPWQNGAYKVSISYFNDRILLNGFQGSNVKVYTWDGANNFVLTSLSMTIIGQNVTFWTASTNSIKNEMDDWGWSTIQSSNAHDCYGPDVVSFDQRSRLLSEGPSDGSILRNQIYVDRRGNGIPNNNGVVRQLTDYTSYGNGRYKIYTSWIDTNDSNVNHNLELHWTQNNQKVYNYNSSYVGGSTITNDNKTSIYNGAFSPAFDLDLGSIADILEALKELAPDIKFGLDSIFDDLKLDLFDKLGEFYGEMPDIDSEWSVDPELNNNNYLDISPPQLPDNPSGGGDVTVNVTVDITRPLVPAVTTSTWLDIEFPSTTSDLGTYPAYISSNTSNIWGITDRLLSPSGLIGLFVLLGFAGIAVSILFKGV